METDPVDMVGIDMADMIELTWLAPPGLGKGVFDLNVHQPKEAFAFGPQLS